MKFPHNLHPIHMCNTFKLLDKVKHISNMMIFEYEDSSLTRLNAPNRIETPYKAQVKS